jgi:hypothetical protein
MSFWTDGGFRSGRSSVFHVTPLAQRLTTVTLTALFPTQRWLGELLLRRLNVAVGRLASTATIADPLPRPTDRGSLFVLFNVSL